MDEFLVVVTVLYKPVVVPEGDTDLNVADSEAAEAISRSLKTF